MHKREGGLFFFLGTEAELIKMFPVMMACKERKMKYQVIASGQNDLRNSQILRKTGCGHIDLELSREAVIEKSSVGLLRWFMHTYRYAPVKIRKAYRCKDLKNSVILVHGDTVSTLMGAMLGKKLGMKVCHVEAGLRSHHLFDPFPEEIDRILTGRIAKIHFAPGQKAAENLKYNHGIVIDTGQNTLLDSLRYSLKFPYENCLEEAAGYSYFVFVLHRQENLRNKTFVSRAVDKICSIAKQKKCVFLLHQITGHALEKFGLMEKIKRHHNIILQPRMDYFDFMKVLNGAAFVITDGGSNQEELFYMGKPCLIMRKTTERREGIGKNAVLFSGKFERIEQFACHYKRLECKSMIDGPSPSEMIAEKLLLYMQFVGLGEKI